MRREAVTGFFTGAVACGAFCSGGKWPGGVMVCAFTPTKATQTKSKLENIRFIAYLLISSMDV
jgi:hypothetical protein